MIKINEKIKDCHYYRWCGKEKIECPCDLIGKAEIDPNIRIALQAVKDRKAGIDPKESETIRFLAYLNAGGDISFYK